MAMQWQCTVCGYIHEGPASPDFCPNCGASADSFENIEKVSDLSWHRVAGLQELLEGSVKTVKIELVIHQ